MQKKKKYTVIAEFWQDGIRLPIGSDVWLFPSEAKYRGHALHDPEAIVAAPAAAAVPEVADEGSDTPAHTAVEVVEAPVRHKRQKRHADAANGNAGN